MNPFLKNLKFTVFKQQTRTINQRSSNGIIKSSTTTIEDVEWEKDKYVKVYTEDKLKLKYSKLSPVSSKIVLYIQIRLEKDKDTINFDMDEVMSFIKIESKSTYYKYIQELIDEDIIAKYKNSIYWVNPELVFNGNRVDYYRSQCPECIDEINITDIQENKRLKRKQDLIRHFKLSNYYQLKMMLGSEQIENLLNNTLRLQDVVLLK